MKQINFCKILFFSWLLVSFLQPVWSFGNDHENQPDDGNREPRARKASLKGLMVKCVKQLPLEERQKLRQ
ncbi:MAG: hypothetical protein SFU25_08955, partial [Candidatus Caenarcaniphilales bacterium]|nr:hypothetical protein [Candidatus Caenarcaniphilales bacterium]